MRIAFYKSQHGTWLDWLIDEFSGRGGFSHCEFIFSDDRFFSSSGLDGGVRFKKINPQLEHWEIYNLPAITKEQESKLRSWCISQVGKKYDYRGVFGFVAKVKPRFDRWFCSEILTAGFQELCLLGHIPPFAISPNGLRYIVISDKELEATLI